MSLLSASQHPQEVYWPPKRVWADVSMGCDCSSPADGFLAILQPGDGCRAGVGSGECCSSSPTLLRMQLWHSSFWAIRVAEGA